MRVVIVRTMPNFSMDVYADSLISGLRIVRPDWEIVELTPHSIDRSSRSLLIRGKKYYERFWGFPSRVKKQTADIFHIIDHSEGHIVNWLKKTDIPIVVTCHDLINYFYRDNLQGSQQLPIISHRLWVNSVLAMQHANHIVTVSSVTAKDTTQILNIEPTRITVIPNTVDPVFQLLSKKQSDFFRQQQGISSNTICLLNVGNDHPRKNIPTILQVVKILKDKGLSIHFWKAGSPFRDNEQKFIQTQGIESHVTYLGKPDKSTLVQIYNAADILIAPSFHEGFGITIIEAMACGTPVITSNVSAMPEVVGNAGIMIDPKDSQAIAEKVLHLSQDSIYYQHLQEKGLARARSFSWENTGDKVAQVYEKVLEQSKYSSSIN
ncbi:glycosyltransferase family 1 protein [Mastigocladus laminosus UU774]|nr:glycosyl transferase group 1 [Westiellopsis prolifica IICB1]TFI55190.1 glycosyltransferase family 1 protein [Mastigocladus laminosus UU774]